MTSEQTQIANEKAIPIIHNMANTFFIKSLWEKEEGQNIGLSYFRERGFNEEIIKKFELGYSPKNQSALYNATIKNSFSKEFFLNQD